MGIFRVMCMVLFGIVVSLQSVNAIECYECEFSDNKCKDPFNKNAGVFNISCDGVCSKTKLKSSGDQVERGCLLGVGFENKCADHTVQGTKGRLCTCTGNLCNGVLQAGVSFVVLVASIVIYLGLF